MTDYDPIPTIIEQMAEDEERDRADRPKREGLDLKPHEDALRWLLREADLLHSLVMSDWRARNEAEGSIWRPSHRLRDNQDLDEPEPTHNYGDMAGEGLEDWDKWWRENYGKGRSNPGRFHLRPDLPKPPLTAVYFLVNKWWRRVLRKPFRPDYSGRQNHLGDLKNMPRFNAAARLFLLIAQELDVEYKSRLCARVHDDSYRKLDTRIE